jgi:hypothetical protein
MIEKIKKLSLEKGDIILMIVKEESGDWNHFNKMAEQVKKCLTDSGHDNLIMVVNSETDIKSLKEEDMNKHGWYKSE